MFCCGYSAKSLNWCSASKEKLFRCGSDWTRRNFVENVRGTSALALAGRGEDVSVLKPTEVYVWLTMNIYRDDRAT